MSTESRLHRSPAEAGNALAWRPAGERGALPDDPALADWLTDAGSLTARLKAACGSAFRLELLEDTVEAPPEDAAGLLGGIDPVRVRRVRLCCGTALCVGAVTLIPAQVLSAEPWLASLGDTPLGEALRDRGGVRCTPFRFARVPAAHPLFAPVLDGSDIRPTAVWTRLSAFRLEGGPLAVYELFLPDLARCGRS
jgi:chorismate--pyruvate lyase